MGVGADGQSASPAIPVTGEDEGGGSLLTQALRLQDPQQKAEVMQKLRVLQVKYVHVHVGNMFSCIYISKKNSLKWRWISTMGNYFGENLPKLPEVQEFLTSVGCFHEITTNCLNTLHNLQKRIYLRMCYFVWYFCPGEWNYIRIICRKTEVVQKRLCIASIEGFLL